MHSFSTYEIAYCKQETKIFNQGDDSIRFNYSKAEILEDDGSLRDIYFLNTSIYDWDKMIAYIINSNHEYQFYKDGEPCYFFKTSIEEIFEMRKDYSIILRIGLSNASLYCHFFDVEEIELDFSPREIIDDETYALVLDFIDKLSMHLGKPAILTEENMKTCILVEFN